MSARSGTDRGVLLRRRLELPRRGARMHDARSFLDRDPADPADEGRTPRLAMPPAVSTAGTSARGCG